MWLTLRAALQTAKRLVPGLNALASIPLARRVAEAVTYRELRHRPERVYTERELLPAVIRAAPQRVLYVGCASYTAWYHRYLRARGIDCWTIDIDPTKAQWGVKGRHVIGDITEADAFLPLAFFDWVIMTGVFGWGVDTVAGMEASIRSLARVIKPGGTLILGWTSSSSRAVPDPLELRPTRDLFRHVHRQPFNSPPYDPVYDRLTRADPPSQSAAD